MTPRTLEIELPLPPKALSPNTKCHWAAKAKAVKQARGDAKLATISAAIDSKQDWSPLAKATMQATFYKRTAHVSDDDNLNASLKSIRDGIADSGIVSDDKFITMLPPVQKLDKANPRLVVVITEVEI